MILPSLLLMQGDISSPLLNLNRSNTSSWLVYNDKPSPDIYQSGHLQSAISRCQTIETNLSFYSFIYCNAFLEIISSVLTCITNQAKTIICLDYTNQSKGT